MSSAIDSFDSWPVDRLQQVTHCPVCAGVRREEELQGLEDRTFGAAPGTWNLHRCMTCRAAYLDPRPDADSIHLAYRNYYTHATVVNDASLSVGQWLQRAIGNGYRNHLFGTRLRPALRIAPLVAPAFREISARIRVQARGLEHLPGGGRIVLDVGCGGGQFLVFARQMGWRVCGVEPDSVAAAVARDLGIEILAPSIGDLDRSHENLFDAVTLSHVIEHVHDPIDTLRHCRRVMKPGGYLWLETPNLDSIGYEIYGRHWRGLEPPRHLVLFNAHSIRVALQSAGFERISFLPCLDVAKYTFMRSAMQRAGRIAEVDGGPLSADDSRRLESEVAQGRALVRRNPDRSEFVVAVAYRPG